ncbi:unnamed protein product [Cylicostephanus goldi]|uniref:Uncharacterized protein n=1 Tax=Cylicostephanus goldi TaxID=71465 RepID=A0A3P6TVW5_CYLGO|nr:unnamed protein product [Cylicostephanus goldi]
MEAITMLEQLEPPAPARSTEREVFIAVPVAFAKVNAEIGYEDNITVYIYTDFGTLANKLLNHVITKSIIVIWPQTMPESRPMRQLLISLERHLADGGALAFFPFPYEDSNAPEWRRMGEVCREFTRYITDPRRNFEALVRDHYSDVLDAAPYTHPAVCLGTTPRRNSTSTLTDKQMLLFLEKMRITIADLIRLPEFNFASAQLREQRAREKARARKRRREERMPNFWVIEDPQRKPPHAAVKDPAAIVVVRHATSRDFPAVETTIPPGVTERAQNRDHHTAAKSRQSLAVTR